MLYFVAATTISLLSSNSGVSSVEDSAMDTGKCGIHTLSQIYTNMYVVHLNLVIAYDIDPESVEVVEDGFYLSYIHTLVNLRSISYNIIMVARYSLAAYPGFINTGAENRAWYQTYSQVLNITTFIPSVTFRLMTNVVFTEDDLSGRRD